MGMLLHTSTLCGKTAMYAQYVSEHVFCGTLLHMQHWSDLQVPLVGGRSKQKRSRCNWEKVSKLKTGQPYINYTGIIEKERLPTISPFTDVVRETISSICVIVASCHMTSQYFLSHDTSPPVTFAVLCYYFIHSMLEYFMQKCRKGDIKVCTLNPRQTCQTSYVSGKEC